MQFSTFRRLRASKLAVGVQTDFIPSKLMKEISLGPQTDLILLKEVGILTDGSYAKRSDGSDECKLDMQISPYLILKDKYILDILTYSVSQMTDAVSKSTVSTQTLIPRLPGDIFLEFCRSNIPLDHHLLQKCSETEKHLLTQLTKLNKYEIPLTAVLINNDNGCEINATEEINLETDTDTDTTTNTIRATPSRKINSQCVVGYNTYRPNLLYPAELSWHFEFDTELVEYLKRSSYTIKRSTFQDNCTTLPYSKQRQIIDLNGLWLAIDEFLAETNNLVELLERITKQKKKSKTFTLPDADCPTFNKTFNHVAYNAPSDYWLPIIEKYEKDLDKLKRFKCADIRNLEHYF